MRNREKIRFGSLNLIIFVMETMISYNNSIDIGIQSGAIRIPITPHVYCRAIVCSQYVRLCERAPSPVAHLLHPAMFAGVPKRS